MNIKPTPSGGVRLSHPTARSGFFTFEHANRPYVVPLVCRMCARSHLVKTYHVKVDNDGFAFVSHAVWDLMKSHNTAGFVLANEVATPPAQLVSVIPTHVDVTPLEN